MKKVIHVDNSDFFRKLMKNFLEKEGFEVESFDTTMEADVAILGGAMYMVIMGLAFADSSGEDFLSRTAESYGGPIIVVSSSVDSILEEKLIALGAAGAINKSGSWQGDLRTHLSALK